jgi:hypothetical protein
VGEWENGRMGDLSGYNALPCNPGNAALLHWRIAEQAKGRLGVMLHLLVQGTNKIPAGMTDSRPVVLARVGRR